MKRPALSLRLRKLLNALPLLAITLVAATPACGGCDAATVCMNKNDAYFTDKIIPVCGAETKNDGTRYRWETPQGTCSCTLDQKASGANWRNCTFVPSK